MGYGINPTAITVLTVYDIMLHEKTNKMVKTIGINCIKPAHGLNHGLR
jgi:hypothetical protein